MRISDWSSDVRSSDLEEKSLSKAAERINLVTSAASKRIAELERHLDRTLLLRHGRGVEPTPAGTLLYQRAKAILRSIQLAENAVNSYSADGLAKLRLAANPSTLLQFLPGKMGRFLSERNTISSGSEEHTSELQSLMRISYAVFGFQKTTTGLTTSPEQTRHGHRHTADSHHRAGTT